MDAKDIFTNQSFCPMPWTGLMYNFDGEVKNCIRSANPIGNIKEKPIEEILQQGVNLNTQQHILGHQDGPNCYPCHNLEKGKKKFSNIASDRIFYIRELKEVPLDVYRPGNHELHAIDVRWTNLCNFACVYCTPLFSSRWAEETGKILTMPSLEQRVGFKKYIFDHIDQLQHVYLAGGEPLLMKENLELLELLSQRNPNVNLRINTNLSKVETKVFEKICQFKNVHWTVSCETIGDEYEYIRYGGTWKDFSDNLDTIQKLGHKISFNMLHFLLNYMSIFDCVDHLVSRGFHNNSFVIGPLLGPLYLNVRHLPKDVLQLVDNKLVERINQRPGYLLEDSYINLLNYLREPFNKDLSNSFAELKTLDQRRKLNSRDIFKELYNLNKEE